MMAHISSMEPDMASDRLVWDKLAMDKSASDKMASHKLESDKQGLNSTQCQYLAAVSSAIIRRLCRAATKEPPGETLTT